MQFCDICGRSGSRLSIDADGLWICDSCQERIKSLPVGDDLQDELAEELRALVGKSAGAICRTLGLPYMPPYDTVIDAAAAIAYDQDLFMSAWLFVSQWQNGSTIWVAEDCSATALVSSDGKIEIQPR